MKVKPPTEEEINELVKQTDWDKFRERLSTALSKIPPRQIDHQLVSTYSEHDNRDYHRDMFIDTRCQEAKVHSYKEMRDLLEGLVAQYSVEAQLFSAGKSQGYGNSDNALDVVGIHIFATEEPKQTAFFVSGHHLDEWSGSKTAYLVAQRLLESDQEGNSNVHQIRKNTHFVFIPQIDVDLYALPNFEQITERDRERYYERGYSRLNVGPDHISLNDYREEEMSPMRCLEQTRAVKRLCDDVIVRYGQPFLAFEYHEDSQLGKFEILQCRARAPPYHPLYVYAEIAKSYPVINEPERLDSQEFCNEFVLTPDTATFFSQYLACKSGYGFVFETPKEENGYSLKQRIKMNLIATDRVLARHYLDI